MASWACPPTRRTAGFAHPILLAFVLSNRQRERRGQAATCSASQRWTYFRAAPAPCRALIKPSLNGSTVGVLVGSARVAQRHCVDWLRACWRVDHVCRAASAGKPLPRVGPHSFALMAALGVWAGVSPPASPSSSLYATEDRETCAARCCAVPFTRSCARHRGTDRPLLVSLGPVAGCALPVVYPPRAHRLPTSATAHSQAGRRAFVAGLTLLAPLAAIAHAEKAVKTSVSGMALACVSIHFFPELAYDPPTVIGGQYARPHSAANVMTGPTCRPILKKHEHEAAHRFNERFFHPKDRGLHRGHPTPPSLWFSKPFAPAPMKS